MIEHLTLRYATGTEPWVPAVDQLALVDRLLRAPATVELLPRAALGATWARTHGGQAMPVPPCSIRAWASKATRNAYIFVDASETPTSVLWLLGHELAHLEITHAPLVELSVTVPRGPEYLATDEGHEADPEEQLCNRVGASLVELLTGKREMLDRRWWRRRAGTRGECSGFGG